MTTLNAVTVQTLKTLKQQSGLLQFSKKLDAVLVALGTRMSDEATNELGRTVEVRWTTEEDISEHATMADFIAAGFSEAEAAAMLFVMTQDCTGQPCTNIENLYRWFVYGKF